MVGDQRHALDAQSDSLGFRVPGQRQYLHRNANDRADAFGGHLAEGLGQAANHPVTDRHGSETADPGGQQIADTSRRLPRQQNQHSITFLCEIRGAALKEIDRQILVIGGEEDALRSACGTRAAQGNHPADFVLRDAEKPQALISQLLRSSKRKAVPDRTSMSAPCGLAALSLCDKTGCEEMRKRWFHAALAVGMPRGSRLYIRPAGADLAGDRRLQRSSLDCLFSHDYFRR